MENLPWNEIFIINIKQFSMGRSKQGLRCKQHKKQREEIVEAQPQQTQGQFYNISKSRAAGLSSEENNYKLNHQAQKTRSDGQVDPGCWSNPLTLTFVLLGLIGIEISIEISVLLIQYICSKVSLNVFCSLLIFSIFLLLLVIISILKVKSKGLLRAPRVRPSYVPDDQPPLGLQQHELPTLLKIQKGQLNKWNEKTKKLKEPYFILALPNANLETIKRIKNGQRQKGKSSDSDTVQRLEEKIFLSLKLIQNVSIFVLGTICLSTAENPRDIGITYVALLIILEFFLILVSSVVAYQIYFIISSSPQTQPRFLEPKFVEIQAKIQNFIKEEPKDASKPQTAISIEQHLNSQSEVPKLLPASVEKTKSRLSSNEKEGEDAYRKQQLDLSPAQQLKLLQLSKNKRNKSVLKGMKSLKSHAEQAADLQNIDEDAKKKVQIDFKKIQYFEYDRSSPANSVICESEATEKKSRIKSKYSIARQQRYSQIHQADCVNKQARKQTKRKTKSISHLSEPKRQETSPGPTRSKFRGRVA